MNRLAFAVLLLLVFTWPAFDAPAADYNDPAYRAAVTDASQALASEISRDLWAVTTANQNLVWEGQPGLSRVKVVTWTGRWSGDSWYGNHIGEEYRLNYSDVWVSAVPQLLQWCRERLLLPDSARLEQLFGLPPQTGQDHFAEFWIWPSQLVRPSPDPEVTDHEAELDFPSGPYLTVSQIHIDWITDKIATMYDCDGQGRCWPWTRLGYTYDWGSDNHVGLSEFIIPRGTTVGIAAVYTTGEYLNLIMLR